MVIKERNQKIQDTRHNTKFCEMREFKEREQFSWGRGGSYQEIRCNRDTTEKENQGIESRLSFVHRQSKLMAHFSNRSLSKITNPHIAASSAVLWRAA